MQINISGNPFCKKEVSPWDYKDVWPSKWLTINEDVRTQRVVLFKLEPEFSEDTVVRVHIAADQRYKLYLNGCREGAGNERGNADNWYFESYDLAFKKGKNTLEVLVWHYGDMPHPWAQISLGLSFIMASEQTDALNTGTAPWEYQILDNVSFIENQSYHTGAGPNESHILKVCNAVWQTPRIEKMGIMSGNHIYCSNVRGLKPATLPPQIHRKINEFSFKVKKGDKLEKIIDLKNYYCFYPAVNAISGKGNVRIYSAESLYDAKTGFKGKRDEFEGKVFKGNFDCFKLDNCRCERESLWWKAGRFIRVAAEAEEDMEFSVVLNETRYPFEPEYQGVNKRHNNILKICLRALQMCCHETFMDCPAYEQISYVADARVEARVMMKYSSDYALIKKAIELFGVSANLPTGFVMGAYPAENVRVMPAFSLLWVGMLYDYVKQSGDTDFLKKMIIIMRKNLDAFLLNFRDNDPVEIPYGWNFIDAVNEIDSRGSTWVYQGPEKKGSDTGCVFNLLLIYTLEIGAELENMLCEKELSARYSRLAYTLMKTVERLYWNESKGIFFDHGDHSTTSEHAQILYLLCQNTDKNKTKRVIDALLHYNFDNVTNIYFKHYLFEAAEKHNVPELIKRELKIWDGLIENGFATVPEHLKEGCRSDCHAWSASPALLDGKYFE